MPSLSPRRCCGSWFHVRTEINVVQDAILRHTAARAGSVNRRRVTDPPRARGGRRSAFSGQSPMLAAAPRRMKTFVVTTSVVRRGPRRMKTFVVTTSVVRRGPRRMKTFVVTTSVVRRGPRRLKTFVVTTSVVRRGPRRLKSLLRTCPFSGQASHSLETRAVAGHFQDRGRPNLLVCQRPRPCYNTHPPDRGA